MHRKSFKNGKKIISTSNKWKCLIDSGKKKIKNIKSCKNKEIEENKIIDIEEKNENQKIFLEKGRNFILKDNKNEEISRGNTEIKNKKEEIFKNGIKNENEEKELNNINEEIKNKN